MELAPAGVSLSFEVTFDSPTLDVAMSVWDNSGSSPVLVQGPDAMGLVSGNTYQGKFLGDTGKSYIIIKAVYTDDSFDTLDDNYSAGSESIVVVTLASAPPAAIGNVVGYVIETETVVGVVDC